jgi:hypothetical protein
LNVNTVYSGSMAPDNGLGVNGDGYLQDSSQFYRKGLGVWGIATGVTTFKGDDSATARWNILHNQGQYAISFIPQWDADSQSYVDVVVLPSNDTALPTLKRNYVSFWNTLSVHQKTDLNTGWSGPWLMDASYAYSSLDSRIQTPYGLRNITFNSPNPLDSSVELHDFYQAITSTYQDILSVNASYADLHRATLTSLTFPNQLIQLADGNWYASVDYKSDTSWEGVPQDWSDLQHLQWGPLGQGDAMGFMPLRTSVPSGEIVSWTMDSTEPISLQIVASCTYKTTMSLDINFFPGLSFLDWENAVWIPEP